MVLERRSTHAPFIHMTVAGSVEFVHNRFLAFEWKSFMNGGYIIRAVVMDPYLKTLNKLFVTQDYLQKMRKAPTPVTFKIGWQGSRPNMSDEYLAYLIDVRATGTSNNAAMEFIAIDPPSWWLNAGKGDGRVYKGKISDVIKRVVQDYSTGVDVEVSDTQDNPQGRWAMMRMDPKTFIKSMLDWSCSLCKKQTNWITASDGDTNNNPKIIIKEQADLPYSHIGTIHCTADKKNSNDLYDFDFASDAIISEYQSKLVTQGISGVSGKIIDKKSDAKHAIVDDDKTSSKLKANIDGEHGFNRPTNDFATSVMAIPELAGGELGLKYADYIDGRARARFLGMLPYVMRIKATIRGNPRLTKSTELGVSTLNLKWAGVDNPTFFMGDNWMFYGFHHKIRPGDFKTDVYLYRFDQDSNAQPKP